MNNLYDEILEVIKGLDDDNIVSLWNEYCRESGNYDDEIMDAYELEEWINNSGDTMNILNRFYYGSDDMGGENSSANPNRNYFCFNGYANIISFDYIYNSYSGEFYHIDIDNLINYIIDNNESFYNSDIQELLDNIEE